MPIRPESQWCDTQACTLSLLNAATGASHWTDFTRDSTLALNRLTWLLAAAAMRPAPWREFHAGS
jgi:hypothetical protein